MYETRRWVYHDEYWPSTKLQCVKTIQDDDKLINYYNFSFFDGEADGDWTIYKIITIRVHIEENICASCGIIYTNSPYDYSWYSWNSTGECICYYPVLEDDEDADHDILNNYYTFDWRYEDLLNDNCESFIPTFLEFIHDAYYCEDYEIKPQFVSEECIIRDLLLIGLEDLKEEISERLKEYSIIRQTLEFKEEDFKYLVEKGYTKY